MATPTSTTEVFEEIGNSNVVAEWQNWGRKLRLPLFIKAGDGNLLPYSQQVDGVMLGQATGRRKLAADAGRRPRFLNRRKPGDTEEHLTKQFACLDERIKRRAGLVRGVGRSTEPIAHAGEPWTWVFQLGIGHPPTSPTNLPASKANVVRLTLWWGRPCGV